MDRFEGNPFEGELEVIATLRDRVIQASIVRNTIQDELKSAIMDAMRCGIAVDDLSEVSGLTPDQIRRFEVVTA